MVESMTVSHYYNSHIVSSVGFCSGDMMRRGDMHERTGTSFETDPILGTLESMIKY